MGTRTRTRPDTSGKPGYITADGYERLEKEAGYLWNKKRPEVTRALADAAAEGDRSENAEYIYRKKQLGEIADKLEGRDLSKLPGLIGKNPSAENVARYFYEQLRGRFGGDVRLAAVRVEEAKGCWGGVSGLN